MRVCCTYLLCSKRIIFVSFEVSAENVGNTLSLMAFEETAGVLFRDVRFFYRTDHAQKIYSMQTPHDLCIFYLLFPFPTVVEFYLLICDFQILNSNLNPFLHY